MRDAVGAGWRALGEGGTALDAVEAAVREPRGPSALQRRARLRPHHRRHGRDGRLDHGRRPAPERRGGRRRRVCAIRSPWPAASSRPAGTRSSRGAGALARARALGVPLCDPAELVTEQQQRSGSAALQAGTVGAVALDRFGTIAAATSTGGTSGKLPGRVGDRALIGCGTYAESTLGGVSCTGDGEAIIRVVLARRTLDILKTVGDPEPRLRGRDERAGRGRPRSGRSHPASTGAAGSAGPTPRRSCRWAFMSPAPRRARAAVLIARA